MEYINSYNKEYTHEDDWIHFFDDTYLILMEACQSTPYFQLIPRYYTGYDETNNLSYLVLPMIPAKDIPDNELVVVEESDMKLVFQWAERNNVIIGFDDCLYIERNNKRANIIVHRHCFELEEINYVSTFKHGTPTDKLIHTDDGKILSINTVRKTYQIDNYEKIEG